MVWFCLSFLLVLFNLTPSWFLHVISAFVDDFFSKCSHIDTYFLISEKKISNIMFISSMMCTPFYEKEFDKSEPKFHPFELMQSKLLCEVGHTEGQKLVPYRYHADIEIHTAAI